MSGVDSIMEDYAYSSLRPNQIRLLKVSHSSHGHVKVTLEHADRQSCQNYTALSYVWGNKMSSIEVNGKNMEVPKSLKAFMKMLREDEQDFKDTWWWIDSICIDPKRVKERNLQVAHMGDIYARAERTIIWLGKPKDDSDTAITFMRKLARTRWESDRKPKKDEGELASRLIEAGLRDEKHDRHWKAVDKLLLRPWWTRVWTVQELVLSQNSRFYCGSSNINRKSYASAMYAIWLCTPLGSGDFPISKKAYSPAWNRRRLVQYYQDKSLRSLPLVGLVAFFSDHNASKDQDRVYSLLGLASDYRLIVPDYDLSTEEVCRQLAESFIKTHRSLDIICFAHIFRKTDFSSDHQLPTWCPDWRVRLEPTVVPMMVSQSKYSFGQSLVSTHSKKDDLL